MYHTGIQERLRSHRYAPAHAHTPPPCPLPHPDPAFAEATEQRVRRPPRLATPPPDKGPQRMSASTFTKRKHAPRTGNAVHRTTTKYRKHVVAQQGSRRKAERTRREKRGSDDQQTQRQEQACEE